MFDGVSTIAKAEVIIIIKIITFSLGKEFFLLFIFYLYRDIYFVNLY